MSGEGEGRKKGDAKDRSDGRTFLKCNHSSQFCIQGMHCRRPITRALKSRVSSGLQRLKRFKVGDASFLRLDRGSPGG